MALSILSNHFKGDEFGYVTPIFRTGYSSEPSELSGSLYYIISDTKLGSYSGQSWVKYGDIDSYEINSGSLYIFSKDSIFYEDLLGKFLYFKAEGVESSDVFEYTQPVVLGRKFSFESEYSSSFSLSSGTNILDWRGGKIINDQLVEKGYYKLDFITKITYRVTTITGDNDEVDIHDFDITENNLLTFDLNRMASGNIYIKEVVCEMNTSVSEDPFILTLEKINILYIRNFSVKKINFTNDLELECKGIHGSLIYDRYFFGSCRNFSEGPDYNQLVRINIDNINDITYLSILDESFNPEYYIDQILEVKGYIYGLCASGLLRISPYTLDYQIFKLPYNTLSVPIILDEEYIYVCAVDQHSSIFKYSIIDLGVFETGYLDMPNPVKSIRVKDFVPEVLNNEVHSGVVDEDYLYAAYTSGGSVTGIYYTVKINKHTLNFVDSVGHLKATDDMTQDNDYLYYGQEYPGKTTVGAFAIDKNTLDVKELSILSPNDLTSGYSATSYASIIYGDYLFDFKTNKRVYLIDKSRTSEWNTDIPAKFTLGEFNYTNNGIINDVDLDYDNQIFHAFCWVSAGNGKSRYVSFTLEGLDIITEPVISILPVEKISDNQFNLKSVITSNGGTPIISSYFEVYTVDDEFVEKIPIYDFSNGIKSVPYSSDFSRKIRFVSENEKGTSTTSFVVLEVIHTYKYIMEGIVYYTEENIPEEDVIIYLIDVETSLIENVFITQSDGKYIFDNLVKNKLYMLAGFKGEKRIVSKVKTPIEVIG